MDAGKKLIDHLECRRDARLRPKLVHGLRHGGQRGPRLFISRRMSRCEDGERTFSGTSGAAADRGIEIEEACALDPRRKGARGLRRHGRAGHEDGSLSAIAAAQPSGPNSAVSV
jgi:hypothetical protein